MPNVSIDVPDYTPRQGVRLEWEPAFELAVSLEHGELLLRADRGGLVSLARILLTLAQEAVPAGHHLHLDDSNSLEEGSVGLILEKLPTSATSGE